MLLSLAGLFAAPSAPAASAGALAEYRLKAVFLFNFAQFAEWPAGAFAGPDAPLVIGVLGQDPFGGVLDETIRGELVDGRPLVLQRYRRVEEIADCHILFVSNSEASRMEWILTRLANRPILTVSDAEGVAERSAMIRFVAEHRRIRLRVNLPAVRSAGLTLSSKLLRSAEIVGETGGAVAP